MDEPEGRYKMRFIGKPGGKLMKGAPGNYEHGRVYMMTWGHSKFKFWELLEEAPTLKVPPMSGEDSVYSEEESVFVPPEVGNWDTSEVNPVEWEEAEVAEERKVERNAVPEKPTGVDQRTRELAEQYRRQNMHLIDAEEGVFVEESPEEPPEEEPGEVETVPDREDLYKALDEAGVEYSKHSRTDYLEKLVEDLDASTEE